MVRKTSIALALTLFLFSTLSAAFDAALKSDNHAELINSDNQSVVIEFELNQLEQDAVLKDGVTYGAFSMPGEGITMENGKPVLPLVSRFVVVPPDAGLELRVTSDEPRVVQAEYPPAILDDEEITASFCLGVDQDNSLYPPVYAEMSEPTIIRGVRMVKVTTYPVQYDEQNNVYLHRDHIRTELVFNNNEAINTVERPRRRNRSEYFLRYINDLAINGNMVGRDDPDYGEEKPYVGHYLIAAHENTIEYAAPFIEWRRKSGYKVDILSFSVGNAGNPGTVAGGIEDVYNAYLDEGVDPFDLLLLIGDRSQYSYPPSAGWILGAPAGQSVWGSGAAHSDFEYGCLEGDDLHPDVGLSRWPSGSENMMELAVARTLMYEATPYMENTEWFTRGLAYSQHWGNTATSAWHLSIHTNVRWAYEVLEYCGFENAEFYEYVPHDQYGQRIGPVIRDLMNEGSNVHLGRAENYYFVPGRGNHSFDGEVEENVVFPMDINMSGHGEWSREVMFRTGSANNLKGYVATSYGWGGPPTGCMNAIFLEFTKGVMLRDLPFGWGYSAAITAYELYFPNFNHSGRSVYHEAKTDADDFGDPGLQPWLGVPRLVVADFPGTITEDATYVEVHVTGEENGEDVAGARVTLYAPGDMPDYDDEDYSTYDEMMMKTTLTDEDGFARFAFGESDVFEGDVMYVTVTGRDIVPEFGEIDIETPDVAVEVVDYRLVQAEDGGNDDNIINPGEDFLLTITAGNVGDSDRADNVTATVTSISPWVEVEDNQIDFGSINAEQSVEAETAVQLHIHPACPDGQSRPGTKPVLRVEFASGDEEWTSSISLETAAPNFIINRVIGDGIIEVGVNDLDLEIENIGSVDSPALTARLETRSIGVNVVRGGARFNAVDVDDRQRVQGEPFVVSGNSTVVPGSTHEMALILSTADDFVDTAYFALQVCEEAENSPQGPDQYGYVCFDDTDDDWDLAPVYDWIEISLEDDDRDYDGTLIDFEGESENSIGEAITIDLNFVTQFYGHEYSQITVATNGFISMGDQPLVTNYMNWPMDRGMGGGVGMIAPFWDDLKLEDNSGIYFYNDNEEHRMIIEWYRMSHKNGGDDDLTFQVMIYDKRYWITETGDTKIDIQYQNISQAINRRAGDTDWLNSNPYASIGISSPDGIGISYSWNNEYPVTSAPLEDRRALRFATSTQFFMAGFLEGYVTDFATNEPLQGATVYTGYGFAAQTDEEGYWFINEALAEVEFDITATLLGYNDSTYIDTILGEDDTLRLDFQLLHPEFTPSSLEILQLLDPDAERTLDLSITNTGNGPLEWTMERNLPGNADVDPWEYRISYPVGDSTGDARIEGAIFIDDKFYLSGSGDIEDGDIGTMIWILGKDSTLIDSFPQPGESRYGLRDLAYDQEEGIIWGSGDEVIFGFNTEGEVLRTIEEGPFSSHQALTWDPDREILWTSGIVSNYIAGLNRDGEEVAQLERFGLRVYGFAYWPEDPDNCPLYIIHAIGDDQYIYKMNPDEGDSIFVEHIQPALGGRAGGIFATNKYDVYSWVLMSVANDRDEDRVDIWQLDARRDWFKLYIDDEEAVEGEIDAGDTRDFALQLSSDGLPMVLFRGMLTFFHNATGGRTVIDVDLDVIGQTPPTPFRLMYPVDGDTVDANDSVEVDFSWIPSIEYNYYDTLSYELNLMTGIDTVSVAVEDTFLTLNMLEIADSLGLSVEEDWYLFWWVSAMSGPDTIRSDNQYMLNFTPNAVGFDDSQKPVEFGLESVYPNPFNSITTINFGLDRAERASLKVFDLMGREVAVLFNGMSQPGYKRLVWDASNIPSGLYILQLESGGRMNISKIALVR